MVLVLAIAGTGQGHLGIGEPFNLEGVADEKGRRIFDDSANLASMLPTLPGNPARLRTTRRA